MAATFTFVQGDRRPFLAVIVKNSLTNEVVDLTSCTATFYFKHQRAKAAKVNGSAVNITSAAVGQMEYRWAATDLDVPGTYDAAFKITLSDGLVQTIVIEGVEVLAKLG